MKTVASARWALFNTIMIFVVGIVLAIGFGVGHTPRINENERDIQALTQSLLNTRVLLDESVMDIVMNSTGGLEVFESVVQNGTYTLSEVEGASQTGPFILKEYIIGPLRFSVLQLDPLTIPLITSSNINPNFELAFDPILLYSFTDFIASFGGAQGFQTGPRYNLPISISNIRKFNLPCIQANTCRIAANSPSLVPNAITFTTTFDGFFQFRDSGTADQGFPLNWNEPLKLILPVA